MSVRLKLIVFLSLLFLVSMGNLFLTFQLEINGDEKLSWIIHTHKVIHETDSLISGVKDAETGQRGYLLTQSLSYLGSYYSGINSSKKNLINLKELTSDNAGQQKYLDKIEQLMLLKFDELSKTVTLTEQGKLDQAMKIVHENSGKVFMDEIRAQIDAFTAREEHLLAIRNSEFQINRDKVTAIITIGIVSMLFLAILTFMFLRNNFFLPLNILMSCTQKMEQGEKLQVNDVISKDELGNLLSAFFQMNEKVHNNTQQLNFKAHHDELTGLKNRSTLYSELEAALEQDKLTNKKTSVFFLDLDNFKQLNDSLGHDVGDLILKETANRLNKNIRKSDSVFRIGGDEFLIIIRNLENDAQIQQLAEDVLERFKTPMLVAGNEIHMHPSIGVAIAPDDACESELIIKYSDIAMYESKRDRKINYRFFDKEMLKIA